jgi:hypothetical protein
MERKVHEKGKQKQAEFDQNLCGKEIQQPDLIGGGNIHLG